MGQGLKAFLDGQLGCGYLANKKSGNDARQSQRELRTRLRGEDFSCCSRSGAQSWRGCWASGEASSDDIGVSLPELIFFKVFHGVPGGGLFCRSIPKPGDGSLERVVTSVTRTVIAVPIISVIIVVVVAFIRG